jgi:tRNA (guanosine-2'-O-)-methyltransferase
VSGGGPKYEAEAERPDAEQLLLPPRKERIEQVLAHRTRNLVVVLEKLEDQFNMAAVLRTCEGLGLQEVHVVKHPLVPWKPNQRVTQGCDKWLDLHRYESLEACAKALKARGFTVLASGFSAGAKSLYQLDFKGKVALVFGNERFGVSPEGLAACDGSFWIPMYGFSQSFNISVAASAALNHAVQWRVEHLGHPGDLSEGERAELRERFFQLSVKQRGRLYPK